MKVGMIFESGLAGADHKVCAHLSRKHILRPTDVVIPIDNANKPELIRNCGKQANTLLKSDRCDRVLIIWDLTPPRGACQGGDRAAIFRALDAVGLPKNAPVYTLCIRAELEAWLLADHKALSDYLSTDAHPASVRPIRYPDREPNPKKRMSRVFGACGKGSYNDMIHAEPIVRKVTNLQRLRKVDSFRRFHDILTGSHVPSPRP